MPDQSDQEKSFQPTAERLREARDQGDVAFSHEIVTVVSLLGTLLYFFFARDIIRRGMEDCLRDYLSFTRRMDLDTMTFGKEMLRALGYLARIGGPIVLVVLVLGIVSVISQIGFQYASKKSLLDFSRLNPAAGFKKLFSGERWFDGLKSLVKALIFGGVCYQTIKSRFDKILILGAMDLSQSLEATIWIAMTIVWRAGLLMILFALVDFGFQKWRHFKKLMMSHQELKDELKQTEGDPRNKQRQRSKQLEMTRNRMIQAVRTADVVLTNPTHYAVALQYDSEKGGAPRLVAKGARLVAQRIKDEATRHGVPIIEDKFLARTIFFACKLGQEIPYSLYRAVAEILAYVYRITGKQPKKSTRPVMKQLTQGARRRTIARA